MPVFNFNKRVQTIVIILVLAMIAVAGLLLLMTRLATSEAAKSTPVQPTLSAAVTPVLATPPATSQEVVATVNDQEITEPTWQQATRLDAAMSQLSGQPIPTAEETLDRLVNEIIVLNAAAPLSSNQPAGDETVEAKIQALEMAWKVNDNQVVSALAQVGLSRADLTARVSRLIQVENALAQLSAKESDLNVWLAQARANSEIGLYRSLANNEEAVKPGGEETPLASPSPVPSPPVSSALVFAPPPDLPVTAYPPNAAPDFTLNQLNGQPLTLSQLRGKPTLVNFWASWCPPCRRELPALQEAYQTYGDKIGFVAVDVKEDAGTVAAFVKEMGLTFPVGLDPDGQVSDVAYEVRGIPTTLFVDANGVVSARHVGPLDAAAIEGYLTPLLAEAQMPDGEETGVEAVQMPGGEETPPVTSSPVLPPAPLLAPDFTLTAADGKPVSLQDYRDKRNVILVFYRGYT